MVLQVLYENIKDKTKILTGKRVQTVELKADGVVVKTADGSVYTGDILVGADGIHSQVRSEMWRLADELSPGWIPSNERNGLLNCHVFSAGANQTQRSHAITDVSLASPTLAMVSSPAHPTQYSENTSRTSSMEDRKGVSTGSTSLSWRNELMEMIFHRTPRKTRRNFSHSEKMTVLLQH